MAPHTEPELMREGGWSRFRRCFDVGEYHVNVYLHMETRRFHVIIWRGPRQVYDAMTPALNGHHTPVTKDFLYAAIICMDAATKKMLVDQPAMGQEMVYAARGEQVGPASFFHYAPC